MDSSNLKIINEAKAEKLLSDKRHQDTLTQISQVNDTILSATVSLIKYLEGHTTKTQVVNQIKHIGTPDAYKVIGAVNSLHETLKTHKNTDLSPITELMQGVLDETKKLPKELPKAEKQQFIDYTKRFETLEKTIKAVEEAVKGQQTTVEAPVINIPAPKVNVSPPDLKPLQTLLKEAVGAIKDNKMPLIGDSIKTHQMNVLVNEQFDEWKILYDEFDEDNAMPVATNYYFKGKKVASLTYSYDDQGRPVGAKKS